MKLLNGNVNVQANTAPVMGGRPLRPLSTRINNRGPPKISDVPALPPDFDVPAAPLPPPPLGQMPPPVTRMPTPYPFDIPHTSPTKRPGFYRPVTIPPWNRRKPPRRPNVPPYKPMPPANLDGVSLTSERPTEDILTLDLGTQLLHLGENYGGSQEGEVLVSKPLVDKEITNFEKNKEKSSSKMNKFTSVVPSTTLESLVVETSEVWKSNEQNKTSESSASETIEESSTSSNNETTDLEIVPTSTTSVIEATPTIVSSNFTEDADNETLISNTTRINEETPVLESSIEEVMQTLKADLLSSSTLANTPTEKLPEITTPTESVTSINLQTEPVQGLVPKNLII